MEAKTTHRIKLIPVHAYLLNLLDQLLSLEDDLKQQRVYRGSLKNSLSDLGLRIELVIQFAPNCDPQDNPQQRENSMPRIGIY